MVQTHEDVDTSRIFRERQKEGSQPIRTEDRLSQKIKRENGRMTERCRKREEKKSIGSGEFNHTVGHNLSHRTDFINRYCISSSFLHWETEMKTY